MLNCTAIKVDEDVRMDVEACHALSFFNVVEAPMWRFPNFKVRRNFRAIGASPCKKPRAAFPCLEDEICNGS